MKGPLSRIALPAASLLAALLHLAVLAGCAETNLQAIQRITPLYDRKRTDLRVIAESLPPPGSVVVEAPPPELDPPPIHDRHARIYNTEIALVAELLDPEWSGASPDDFDPILTNQLFHCLAWTGPKNPMDPGVLKKRGDLYKECEGPLGYRYLVALRTTVMRPPEAFEMEGFFIDLVSRQIRWTFLVKLRSSYTAEDLGRGTFAAQAHQKARSELFSAVRCAVQARLNRIPGALFDFENDWPGTPRSDKCRGVGQSFRVEGAPPRAGTLQKAAE